MKKIAFLLSIIITSISFSSAQNCTDPCANNTGDALPCTYAPDYNVCDDGCDLTTDVYDHAPNPTTPHNRCSVLIPCVKYTEKWGLFQSPTFTDKDSNQDYVSHQI